MKHLPYSLVAAALPNAEDPSAGHLAALADLACASGDRQLAEELIDRIYAYYDRRQSFVATLAESAYLMQKFEK